MNYTAVYNELYSCVEWIILLCRTAYTAVYHSLSPMRGFVFYLWIINWTRLSNKLDTSVQWVGQVCPIDWTNLSNLLDTFVQFAHAIRLICFPTVGVVASLLVCIWADARAVRPYMLLACKSFFDIANPKVQYSKFNVQSQSPYIPVMAKLMCKMVEMASCASACRDARLVRPPKTLRAFASTTMLFDFHSPLLILPWL